MYRLVAIFFLLWTMTDLSVPQVCMADFDVPAFGAGASNDQPAMTAVSAISRHRISYYSLSTGRRLFLLLLPRYALVVRSGRTIETCFMCRKGGR
jgi:hypothetical protein